MYRCCDCNKEFEYVEVVFESHGLSTPPFERRHRCPFCASPNFIEKESRHCHFCGSKMDTEKDYCSDRCKLLGERYFKEQAKNLELFKNSSVARAVREVAKYNKENGTKYSYGKYFSLKEAGKI